MRFEACLLAAIVTAAATCPQPAEALGAAAFRAAWFVLLVGGVTAIVASLSTAEEHPVPSAFGGNAVWFAPLAIFVAQGRAWTLLIAALVGIASARLLGRYGDEETAASHRQRVSFAATLAMMAAFVAYAIGWTALAALLTGAASFTITCLAAPEVRTQTRARVRMKFAAQGLFAALLALLGLVRIPAQPVVHGKGGSAKSEGGGGGMVRDDLLSGAILLAEPPRGVKLIAPVPHRGPPAAVRRAAPPPSIEFSGAYWIYPYSMMGPPKSSLIVRSTPVNYNFTAVDRTALRMRARQQLGRQIEARCCSAIEVVARNEDRQPDTIALRLTLRSSRLPRAQSQPLGLQKMDAPGPVVLRFAMPASPVIPAFDEIIVDFELAGRRQHRSANVTIERFVLVPRSG